VVVVNEGVKTGIYWIAAVAMLLVAIFVSQAPESDSNTEGLIGQPLFPTFTDPLAASILRITTFNEEQGELGKFEVAKDEQSGVWSLPSRNNYPADASEQMRDAANALVGVKVLDIQTESPEDHASLGVLEPNVESLEAGDEGVGRLVTFKGANNSTLAEVIIGNAVKGSEGKRYARVPGQDPVYVVTLDDKPLSTKFEDWIEKDLLQLSSIDISEVEVQNYDAALEMGNALAIDKHYDAKLSIDGSNAWQLNSLVVYDEQGEPKETKLADGEKLATAKLNSLKNALDDLKIVDVAAKPKGMSENLKADKDLVSDQQAVLSLATRGFFPVTQGDILSANGEMVVTLKDGVQYVLRFGNVKGIEESEKKETTDGKADADPANSEAAGSNRYLLVTTRVDESKFPPPELATIPKTVDEMEAAEAAKAKAESDAAKVDEVIPATETTDSSAVEKETEAPAEEKSNEPKGEATEAAPEAKDEAAEVNEGTTDQTGTGEASGSGQGQEKEEASAEAPAISDAVEPGATATDAAPAKNEAPAAEAKQAPADIEPAAAEAATSAEPAAASAASTMLADTAEKVETAEEKLERLEAEQEKITKENQRKLDERKDKLETARRRVRELNGRFADWYYVIPETTYRQLRLSREEMIEKPAADVNSAPDEAAKAPAFDFQGLGK